MHDSQKKKKSNNDYTCKHKKIKEKQNKQLELTKKIETSQLQNKQKLKNNKIKLRITPK